MSSAFAYDKVLKYKVTAVLEEPLHVGSTGGDPEEVLVHPVDGRPFIQASGLTGAFRDAWKEAYPDSVNDLFGARGQDTETASRIVFSDGILTGEPGQNGQFTAAATELRPRVKINAVTGSVGTEKKKGTQNSSGTKFNMQYVGAGAELNFTAYIFTSNKLDNKGQKGEAFNASARSTDESSSSNGKEAISLGQNDDQKFRYVLGMLDGNEIQFGGQKSNGCGYVQLSRVLYKAFDLRKEQDRSDWLTEETLPNRNYDNITAKIQKNITEYVYAIKVKGQTEGSLLVKALSVPDVGKGAPCAQNIQNAKKEYIIPGSSFKGAVRARMTQIASYLERQNSHVRKDRLISNAFGVTRSGNETGSTGVVGNLRFRDTVVGTREENNMAALHHRIHIDKFTGGVMNGSLFSTKDVHGNLTFTIGIENCNHPDQTLGLLLLALRDLGAGCYNLGSGYNVGKGFITVNTIQVARNCEGQTENVIVDMEHGTIQGDPAVLTRALAALEGEGGAQ